MNKNTMRFVTVLGVALVLCLALARATLAAGYTLGDHPFQEPHDEWVDLLVADLQKAGLEFTFDRFQLQTGGHPVSEVPLLTAAQAARLFALLDVHISSHDVQTCDARGVYELLLDKVDRHSPNWKAKLRNIRTLKMLFPDGGLDETAWQCFSTLLTRVTPRPVSEYLVINRETGACYWIETS